MHFIQAWHLAPSQSVWGNRRKTFCLSYQVSIDFHTALCPKTVVLWLSQAPGSLARLVKTQVTWFGPWSFGFSSSMVAERSAFLASPRVMLMLLLWDHTGRTVHLGSSQSSAPWPTVAAERWVEAAAPEGSGGQFPPVRRVWIMAKAQFQEGSGWVNRGLQFMCGVPSVGRCTEQ